jgi:hypothetical protein
MKKKTYRDLINEVKSYNDIKVPSELRHPPSLSFNYERKLEKVLSVIDSINSDHGDRETQYQLFAKLSLDLMVELIDSGIDVRLKTKHILRMKNAKIDSLEKILNPPKKKKKGGGSDDDLESLKDTLGI